MTEEATKTGSARITELNDMTLPALTKIYNELAETPVKKLKCSKMQAALKIYELEGGDETYPTPDLPKTVEKTSKQLRAEKAAAAKEKAAAKKKEKAAEQQQADSGDALVSAAQNAKKGGKAAAEKKEKPAAKEKPAENPKQKISVAETRKMAKDLKVGKFCIELLKKFYPYDDILEEIGIYYPEAKTSKASLAWYKNKLKEDA